MIRCITLFLLLSLWSGAEAQVIRPNESSIVVPSPKKIGINLNGPTYYGAGELYKNLIWRNPGFEPNLYRDKFVTFVNGTTTTFIGPSQYDPVVANFWTGASFKLYRGSPKSQICSGTISGNTTSTSTTGPTYTFSSACSSPVAAGDVIVLRQAIACTPEADWESSHAGWWASNYSGGKLVSECSAQYDGAQALRLDASVSGSSAGATAFFDSGAWDVGILLNGQYTISGYYRTIGNPTLSVSGQRSAAGSAGNPFNCATKTFAASPAWTAFSSVCTGNETRSVGIGHVAISFSAQNGIVILDDVSFVRTSGNDPSNTTVFRDELVNTLKAHCSGASLTGVPCELRDWAFQNADEIDNTIKPLFQRSIAVDSFNYDYAGGQGFPSISVSFEEFLELCKAIGAEPYYVLPESTGPEDGAKWVEYLNGPVSTPYGSKRSANGQTASWLSVFPTVHLSMGNENWNEGTSGDGLGYRPGAPDYYYDYSSDAAGVWGAMRAGGSWPAGGAGIDLVLGFQDANVNNGITEAMTRTGANSGELAPYTQSYVGDTSSLTALWSPLLYEVVGNTTNGAMTFYQQANAIKAFGKLNVYEFDNSTLQGPANLTQSVLDSFTDAAGYGTATALQALQHLSFGIVDQNFFSLDQYYVPGPNGTVVHNWGAVIDMGGATNALRPQELGMRMANAAIIGPMYACPVTAPTTANLGANHNGPDSNGTPPATNIPQEYAFCFLSGLQRSMVVINTDVTNAHSIAFAGPQAPTGAVTVTRYDPSSISASNEAAGTSPTNTATQNVAIDTPYTVANLQGDSLPPYSITRYDWVSVATAALRGTTTALSVSNNTPSLGSTVVLTAAVTSSAATGVVTFMDGTTTLGNSSLNSGAAAFTINAIQAGNHTYTAIYEGDTVYASSTSSAINVSVASALVAPYIHTTFNEFGLGHALGGTAPATDTNGALWSDPNNDWTYLPAVGIISATADLTNPTLIDTSHASYTATFGYPAIGAQLLFRYVDSNNYLFAFVYPGQINMYARVAGATTTLATIYPANPAAPLLVTVNGTTVTIECGGQTDSGTIPSNLLTGTTLGFFPRSAAFVISSLDVSPPVAAALSSTSTALNASINAPTAGANLALTANITPFVATGTVAFFDGSTSLGSATVSAGSATFVLNSIAGGTHSFTAVYSGDSSYATSSSAAVAITAQTPTTTGLASSSTMPGAGTSITLTASVAPSAAQGAITFYDGNASLGSSTISGGSATYTINAIAAGVHSFRAGYGGNSLYSTSSSATLLVTTIGASSTTLTAPSTSPAVGSSFTLTASVAPSSATGTVTFSDGAITLGTVPLGNSQASYTVSAISAGTHSYTAFYGGSDTYSASSSSALSVQALSPTSTFLRASDVSPSAGAGIVLIASVSPRSATGSMIFKDGDTVLATTTLAGGRSTYAVPSVSAGTHSYSSVYSGSSNYASSTSAPIVVNASANSTAYIHTTFNEFAANSPLDGTAPAVNSVGSTWSDPNGDWVFASGGGIASITSDLVNPTLINAAHADYTATFTYPSTIVQLLFRYVDSNNYLYVMAYPTEIDLYAEVSGASTVLATIYPSNTAAPLSVKLNGLSGTISSGGQTASGTIPAALIDSADLGFFSRAAHFVISSMDVSP